MKGQQRLANKNNRSQLFPKVKFFNATKENFWQALASQDPETGMGSLLSAEKDTSENTSKGGEFSTVKADVGSRPQVEDEGSRSQVEDGRSFSNPETNQAVGQISEPRFRELMQALKHIARLQSNAVNTRIDGRQKQREAFFKRQDVWIRDAKFMKEVQRLAAVGQLTGNEELARLASDCQAARDGLGPVEQENIEAEQRWQGHMWKLRQAEEYLYTEFRDEFKKAEDYSDGAASLASSQYRSSSEVERQSLNNAVNNNEAESEQPRSYKVTATRIAPSMASSSTFSRIPSGINLLELDEAVPRELILLGLDNIDSTIVESDDHTTDGDSGVGDLNDPLEYIPPPESFGPGVPLPRQNYNNSLEPYPQLLTDFTSGGDRIDRWLENTTLASRFEVTSMYNTLKSQLQAEKKEVPSNWAQLVIAYWELKGASIAKKPFQGIVRDACSPKSRDHGDQGGATDEKQIIYEAEMLQQRGSRSFLFSNSTPGMPSRNDVEKNGNSRRCGRKGYTV